VSPLGFFTRAYGSRIDCTVNALVSLRCVVDHKKNDLRGNALPKSTFVAPASKCLDSNVRTKPKINNYEDRQTQVKKRCKRDGSGYHGSDPNVPRNRFEHGAPLSKGTCRRTIAD
jgi:hypothetical protein